MTDDGESRLPGAGSTIHLASDLRNPTRPSEEGARDSVQTSPTRTRREHSACMGGAYCDEDQARSMGRLLNASNLGGAPFTEVRGRLPD